MSIYTDGGCHGNPGPGGWAVVLRFGDISKELSGGELATTNNRMELQAAIAGLSELKEPCDVTIYTDSQYLRQGITGWIRTWKARGWLTQHRLPVKNADLWKQLDEAARRHKTTWQWIRGHSGQPDNERCDILSSKEIQKILSRTSPANLSASLKAFQSSQATPETPLLL